MDDVDALLNQYNPKKQPDDVDAILQQYAQKPAPEAEAQPGYYSPGEVAKRAGMGILGSIPGAGSALMAIKGKNPYTPDAEGVSRGVGDASQGLLTAATLGHGLGAGALVNAGLEASGANDLAHMGAQKSMDSNLGKPILDAPSKLFGVEGLGTVANAASRIPGTLGAIASELVPSALTLGAMSLRGGGALKPSAMETASKDLNAEGGQAPVSSQVNLTPARELAAAQERSAKINPLTKGSYEKQDALNTDVLQKHFQTHFGPDIFEPVAGKVGGNTLATIESMANRRAAAYQPVIENLKAQGKLEGLGAGVADAVGKAIGGNYLVDQVATPWSRAIKSISGMTDPLAIMKKLTSLRLQSTQENPLISGQISRDWNVADGAAKDDLYGGLNKAAGGLGDALKKANYDYMDASQPLNRVNGLLSGTTSPEHVMPTLLRAGSKPIGEMMADMTPQERAQFQNDAARFMLESSKKQGALTSKGLGQIPSRFRNVMSTIFGDSNGQAILGKMQQGAKLMKVANIGEIGNFNPSGSGALLAEQGGKLRKLATLGGATDLAYTYGLRPLVNAATRSIPGTPQMPSGLLQAAIGAREVGRQLNQNNLNE